MKSILDVSKFQINRYFKDYGKNCRNNKKLPSQFKIIYFSIMKEENRKLSSEVVIPRRGSNC